MIDLRILLRALVVGIVLQAGLAFFGHAAHWVAGRAHEFGRMMIAATAAYLYAMHSGRGYFPGATAGAIVGGTCGLIGIALSVLLKDTPSFIIPIDTAICVLTGTVGGLFGQMAANWRAFENRKRD